MDIEDDDEEGEASQSFSQISLESPSRSEESIIEISSDSNTEQSFPSTRGQKRKTRPDQEKVPSPASKQSHRISLAEEPSPEPVPLVQNYLNEVGSAQEGIPGVPGHKEWIPTSAVATHLVCPECKINVTVALMKNHLSSYLHEKSTERIYIDGWAAYNCGLCNTLVDVSNLNEHFRNFHADMTMNKKVIQDRHRIQAEKLKRLREIDVRNREEIRRKKYQDELEKKRQVMEQNRKPHQILCPECFVILNRKNLTKHFAKCHKGLKPRISS